MTYHKVQFSGAVSGLGYQVIDANGNQVSLTLEDGTVVSTIEAYEVAFIEVNAPKPSWGE